MVSSEMLILKQKHYGERCTECFDEFTNTLLKTKCEICYGTSFTGGYYSPIRILVENSVEQINKDVIDHGYAESIVSAMTIQDVPRITRDDLVYDPVNKKMWKTVNVNATSLNKTPSTQTLHLTELSRDSIEYSINIDPENILNLYNRVNILENP
mgnify:CR=1 FL=1